MAKRSASINLLKNSKNDGVGQIINWALTVGRVLVITVELIALGAFLYRFGLDRQLIDLHTTIKQKQTIVSYLKDSETVYRNLQDRLAIASSFSNVGSKQVKIFTDIIGFAPTGFTFNEIVYNEDSIRIEANVFSVEALTNFISSLKSYEPLASVSIDKIENKTSNAVINVSITAKLKQKGAGNETTQTQ